MSKVERVRSDLCCVRAPAVYGRREDANARSDVQSLLGEPPAKHQHMFQCLRPLAKAY